MVLPQLKNFRAVVQGHRGHPSQNGSNHGPSSARASSVPGKLWVLEVAYFTPRNSTQAHIHKCKDKAQQKTISQWGPAKKSARSRL